MRKTARLPLDDLRPWLIELPDTLPLPPPTIDWKLLFGNDRPVELEVGFGKGLFLLTESEARPEVNFAGVEIERKYVLFTATRLAKRGRSNVRVACADAREFLRDRVAAGSLHGMHVYFPDPWWKKRHHKRRVFTEEFARQCARVLKPGGILHVVTDVPEYFQVMTELLATVSEFRFMPPPEEKGPEHDLDYLTNFERKFRKEGKPIHRARCERV